MTATLATPSVPELTTEKVTQAVQLILDTLGTPQTSPQQQALEAFQSGDHALVKRISLGNLNDSFCKCLGYLGSAYKLLPTTDTILSEAARAALDHKHQVESSRLGQQLVDILN